MSRRRREPHGLSLRVTLVGEVALGVADAVGRVEGPKPPVGIEGQGAVAQEPGARFEPVVDPARDEMMDTCVLQDARAEVQVREEDPAGEALPHRRVGKHLIELAEDETLGRRAPSRRGDVAPVEADDLVAREAKWIEVSVRGRIPSGFDGEKTLAPDGMTLLKVDGVRALTQLLAGKAKSR